MAGFAAVDFDEFHCDVVPSRTDTEVARAAATFVRDLAPIAFRLPDGRAYTFVGGRDAVTIESGDASAGVVVELSEPDWQAFAVERFTRYGLLYNGRLSFASGAFEDLCRWEPTLRALFHGRPVYDPASLRFEDLDGSPLDLSRRFTLDDEPAALAHFLQTTGYLHVGNVFSGDEVAALAAEIERLASLARPDADRMWWWTKTPDGEPVVCQLKYGAANSETITALHDDARIRALLDAAGAGGLQPNLDRNEGTKIIFKHPGATEGLTDLPLHTDCGMGYHPVACPMVLIGVQLDAGTPATGQLHMAAGSHRATTPDPAVTDTSSWPIVALGTQPGDCTVHFGHTLHAAPPPAGGDHARGRRTIYPCFAPPSLFDALAPFEDLVTVMQRDDGVTMTVDERLAH
jgi:hypothetical protein